MSYKKYFCLKVTATLIWPFYDDPFELLEKYFIVYLCQKMIYLRVSKSSLVLWDTESYAKQGAHCLEVTVNLVVRKW